VKKSRLTIQKTKGNRFFFGLHAVMKSRAADNESTYKLNYIQVKDGKISASNGHCLCVVDIPEKYNLEEGYYLPLRNTKTQIDIIRDPDFVGEFPDVESILKMDQGEIVKHDLKSCSHLDSVISGSYTEVVRLMSSNNALSIKLFKKFVDFDYVEIPKTEHRMLKFHSPGVVGFVMTMMI
jgi:hypothetical protein